MDRGELSLSLSCLQFEEKFSSVLLITPDIQRVAIVSDRLKRQDLQ